MGNRAVSKADHIRSGHYPMDPQCQSCQFGKSKRCQVRRGPRVTSRHPRLWEIVYGDLVDVGASTHGQAKWCLVLVDDYSRYKFCHPLKAKSDAWRGLLEFISEVGLRPPKDSCVTIYTDGGGEFEGRWLQECRALNIRSENTAPYSSDRNPIAERENGEVFATVRAVLHSRWGCPESGRITKEGLRYWGEAAKYTAWLRNHKPHPSLQGKRPIDYVMREVPSYHDRPFPAVFGEECWVHLPKDIRKGGKLGPRAIQGTWVGWSATSDAYRIVIREPLGRVKVMVSRSVQWMKTHENRILEGKSVPLVQQSGGDVNRAPRRGGGGGGYSGPDASNTIVPVGQQTTVQVGQQSAGSGNTPGGVIPSADITMSSPNITPDEGNLIQNNVSPMDIDDHEMVNQIVPHIPGQRAIVLPGQRAIDIPQNNGLRIIPEVLRNYRYDHVFPQLENYNRLLRPPLILNDLVGRPLPLRIEDQSRPLAINDRDAGP